MFGTQRSALGAVAFVFLALIFSFQNCSPAKLSGGSEVLGSQSAGQDETPNPIVTPTPNPATPAISTVGSKVNLTQLLNSPAIEPKSNIIYPAFGTTREVAYGDASPMIENVLVKSNDFSRIEWILATTSTVVSNGDILRSLINSSEMAGPLLVFGYRGNTAYLIAHLNISMLMQPLSASSIGAVQINQRVEASNGGSDSYSIEVNAPKVDVKSIEFILKPSGKVIRNLRALLVEKNSNENLEVTVTVTDRLAESYVQVLNFPASAP